MTQPNPGRRPAASLQPSQHLPGLPEPCPPETMRPRGGCSCPVGRGHRPWPQAPSGEVGARETWPAGAVTCRATGELLHILSHTVAFGPAQPPHVCPLLRDGGGPAARGSGLQPRVVTVTSSLRGYSYSTEVEETGGCRLRTGHLLAPMAQAGRDTPCCPELNPTVPLQGPAWAAPPTRAKAPSSHSARHGPRSRGGKTPQSPRKAPRGRPRRAGVSARAGSGRAPRPSWSCCSGCACWWTAGSGSGSGCGDDGTESVRGPASSLGTERPQP